MRDLILHQAPRMPEFKVGSCPVSSPRFWFRNLGSAARCQLPL